MYIVTFLGVEMLRVEIFGVEILRVGMMDVVEATKSFRGMISGESTNTVRRLEVVNVEIPLKLSSELRQPFRINLLYIKDFPLFNSGGSRELDFHFQCVPVGWLF